MQLPEGFGRETAVLPVAFAYHRQCGCLHPSDGVRATSGGNGECPRAVNTHEPVGFAPRFGGEVEVIVPAAVLKVAQPLADSLVGKRAYPQAHERSGATRIVVEVTEDKLSLATGIGGDDDLFTLAEQGGDDLYLRHDPAVGLVALVRLYLTGNERESFGDDGQVVADEAAYAVVIGHGKLDEMSERPCHGVAASLEISFLSLCRPHDTGDFTCH